jgi:hypothetical protein
MCNMLRNRICRVFIARSVSVTRVGVRHFKYVMTSTPRAGRATLIYFSRFDAVES